MCLLKLTDIKMTFKSEYNSFEALKGINFAINQNEIISISGASGAGKTTLLNVMAGLQKPTSGTVIFKGEDLYSNSDARLSEIRIMQFGFVFQAFHLIQALTVYDNIVLPSLYAKGFVNKTYFDEVVSTLNLGNRLSLYPDMLSAGEKQRVAIARAIINEPRIVFADEPTGNLDSINSDIVFSFLFKLCRRNNSSLVFVSHEENYAEKADRRFVLKDGAFLE